MVANFKHFDNGLLVDVIVSFTNLLNTLNPATYRNHPKKRLL
jgi:hypothetical protein